MSEKGHDPHQAAGLLNYAVPSAELDGKLDWLIKRLVDKSPTAICRGIAYTESQIACWE